MSTAVTPDVPQRLVSLDAYRGFVMLAMVSGGLALTEVAEEHPYSATWQNVAYQLEHVQWSGCTAWDLIQPSFMFIVGVAMPFSYASRVARGESKLLIGVHTAWRALLLVAIGIFLRSYGREQTNFTFEDVATQIGLGYALVFLVLGRGRLVQFIAAAVVLLGYWAVFAFWPPATEAYLTAHNIPGDWAQFEGFAAHWNKYLNPAGYFDVWFLNLFPRPEVFDYNRGGYQTLNFVPSMGTMIFGIMTGEMLRGPRGLWAKIAILVLFGLLCLGFGMAVDGYIWPHMNWTWSVAPIVKRIWTPSWAVFSTGWVLLTLAFFVIVIDAWRVKFWAFPLIVVGMNSIVMYVMSWLFKPWVRETLHTHLPESFFDGTWGPVIESSLVLLVLWLVVFWLYRRGVFVRI